MTKKKPATPPPLDLASFKTDHLLEKDPRDSETKVLHIPLTAAEHREFKAQAGARDISMTQFFRRVYAVFLKHEADEK